MEDSICYICLAPFLEPSDFTEIARYPPSGRKYWSGDRYFGAREIPDSRCYDRYAWDVPMCGHPTHVVCSNSMAKSGGEDRCGVCRKIWTIKTKIIFTAMPTQFAEIVNLEPEQEREEDVNLETPPGKKFSLL
jgi:hypothetical protein